MKITKDQTGSAALVAVVVVAVAIIGLIAFKVGTSNKNGDSHATAANMSVNTKKASDLRANLVTMAVEHMTLTQSAVAQTLDGSKGATAAGTGCTPMVTISAPLSVVSTELMLRRHLMQSGSSTSTSS